jgi:AcrR family transcriptional regulator
MARTIKEKDYNVKRNLILDFALSLIYSKGYEQMTIQDILDGLQISRGALYHYFDSKHAILEALVDQMEEQAEQIILPVVQDQNQSALQKFHSYFEASAHWKNMQKKFVVNIMRMWYVDENILIRHKLTSETMKRTPRLIEPIIRQGIEEKVFTTSFPEQASEIIVGITLSLADTIFELMFLNEYKQAGFGKFEIILDAYTDAIERILGAPSGSLQILEKNALRGWFDTTDVDSTHE